MCIRDRGDGGRFQNAVARRVAPSRNDEAAAKPAAEGQTAATPKPAEPAAPEAPQSISDKLKSLADRFR